MNSINTDSNIQLTELQSAQNTELDLSDTRSQQRRSSLVFINQPHKTHERKHRKQKAEDDDEPSYISFYRYPIKSYDEQKKRRQFTIIESPLDKKSPLITNKHDHKKRKLNNVFRRSFTPQKNDSTTKSMDQQDDQKSIFQRLQISKISKLFVLKIRQLSQQYNYRHLRKVQFDLIGDVATSKLYEPLDQNNESHSYQKKIERIFYQIIMALNKKIPSGCLFHYVGQSQMSAFPQNNWLFVQEIHNAEWQERYICSIYFAFTTLMNVIYGDIHAYNHFERFTVMAICLCSYISFGYFLTVVGLLLQEFAASLEEFYLKRQKIMNYMIQRSISRKNQIKMMHYLEYLLRKSQKSDEGSVKLLDDVPTSLKNSLFQDFFGKVLTQNKYIPNHLSHSFLSQLCQIMEEIIIQPEQQFVQEGEMQTKVYFLIKGQIEIFLTSRKKECVLQKYTTRGVDICLKSAFTNQPISYSVKSSSEKLVLAYFEMEKFLQLIKQYPEDYESFCQWRDELILKEHQLTFKCKSCKNIDHELDECPLINLRLPKQKIINQYFFDETQERIYIQRKKYIFKALPQKSLVNMKLKQFRIFLTKAVVPQMSQDEENLLQMSDENFYQLMPPIKIVNCDANMMFEFSSDKVNQGIEGMQQDLSEDQIQKRISLEKIVEISQSSSSSETTSSSDDSYDSNPKTLHSQKINEINKNNLEFGKSSFGNSKFNQKSQSIIQEKLGIQKNVGLLSKQKQHIINMNSLIEQKKKINNNPYKPNVPIQGLKKRTDKISSLYTKILFREQQKQKRLKYLQFLWAQKQNQKNSFDRKNNQSQISKIKNDKLAYDTEFNELKKKNTNQQLFLLDFDKIETFKRYNPFYNYDKVVIRYNIIQLQINNFNNIKKTPQLQKNHKKFHLFEK